VRLHQLIGILLCTGAGAIAPASAATKSSAPFDRPNILFAIADDQSWAHTSIDGCAYVKTPAFDRVAREGVRFSQAYCASPSCTPSRSTVLAGRHIWQIGEGGVLYGTLEKRYPLFTHLLADAGYFAGWTGKGWGPGDWQAGGLERHPIGREYNSELMDPRPHETIDARDYAANFAAFLEERPAGEPFFFWFGATEPHRVYEKGSAVRAGKRVEDVTVPSYWPDTEEIRSDLLDYAHEIEWWDAHLARMLAKLAAIGELANTLVLVTSDNGMPFPRAKVTLYDPGVRMPLAVRWPGRVKAGGVIEDMVSHIDLAPTFLEAAGVAVPALITGRSLLPLLTSGRGGRIDPARAAVYSALERHTWCRPDGATYPMRALRTEDFLYIHNFEPDRWPTGGPEFISSNKTVHGDVDGCPTKEFMEAPANQAQFAREFALCFGQRPLEELYNVRSDPEQVHNLARNPAYRIIREKLWMRLRAYLVETGDPRVAGQDPWQAYAYRQTVGFGATFNRTLSAAERDAAAGRAAHKPQ
jgi:uncharacterized sulfatase